MKDMKVPPILQTFLQCLVKSRTYTTCILCAREDDAFLNNTHPSSTPKFPEMSNATSIWGLQRCRSNKEEIKGPFVVQGIAIERKKNFCAAVRILRTDNDALAIGEFRCVHFEKTDVYAVPDYFDAPLVVQPQTAPLVPAEFLCEELLSGLQSFGRSAVVCTSVGIYTLAADVSADRSASREYIRNAISGITTVIKVGTGEEIIRLTSNVIAAVTRHSADKRSMSTLLDLTRQELNIGTVPKDVSVPDLPNIHPSLYSIGEPKDVDEVARGFQKALGASYSLAVTPAPFCDWQQTMKSYVFDVTIQADADYQTESTTSDFDTSDSTVDLSVTWPPSIATYDTQTIIDATRMVIAEALPSLSRNDLSGLLASVGPQLESALQPGFSAGVHVLVKAKTAGVDKNRVPSYASNARTPRMMAFTALLRAAGISVHLYPWTDSGSISLAGFP